MTGRQQNHQKQVPPPLPPPPRLAQNPAQSTLVSDAVITSPPQHLDDAGDAQNSYQEGVL